MLADLKTFCSHQDIIQRLGICPLFLFCLKFSPMRSATSPTPINIGMREVWTAKYWKRRRTKYWHKGRFTLKMQYTGKLIKTLKVPPTLHKGTKKLWHSIRHHTRRRKTQSGRKCVIVASSMRAEQGPCEPIKGYIRKIREQ